MKLTDGEKLILVMLADIYKHLEIKGEIDPELVTTSIFNDKAWGLKWEYGMLFNNPEDNAPVVQETCDILDMYRLLTPSFEKLSPEEKKRVEAEADPFGSCVKFEGFDANNDDHYGVVTYLVKNLRRYEELKDTYLNSHSISSLSKYRRMLQVYKAVSNPYPRNGLTADQIIQVLKA